MRHYTVILAPPDALHLDSKGVRALRKGRELALACENPDFFTRIGFGIAVLIGSPLTHYSRLQGHLSTIGGLRVVIVGDDAQWVKLVIKTKAGTKKSIRNEVISKS